MKKPVIYDGDMGGDDMWGIMMMLAYPDRFDVKGITTVFGNVDCDHATRNVLDLLSYCSHTHIPVYKGVSKPLQGECMFGDAAYGDDGIGGVVLKGAEKSVARDDAVSFIVDTIMGSQIPVTIFATGPLTNIAHALQRNPGIVKNIEAVIVMGGGLAPGPRPDVPGRAGNITIHSEFNFFQDPYAVNVVMNAGACVHVVTMDATQHLYLGTKERQRILALKDSGLGQIAVDMLMPAEALDRPKFGVEGPFIHDPNVVIYALHPDFYEARRARVHAEEHPHEDAPMHEMRHGKMYAEEDRQSLIYVVDGMKEPQKVFDAMETAFVNFVHLLQSSS